MFGREAAKRELGASGTRWLTWTVIIYLTVVFFLTWDFSRITLGGSFLAMGLSALSTFGALSLLRDIVKGKLKQSIQEIWEMINGRS